MRPIANKKLSKRERVKNSGRQGALESEVNARTMMSVYYTDPGGFDICNITSFLGISGGKSWERTYHRNSSSMTKPIIKVADAAMCDTMNEEIKLTIKSKLEGKMGDAQIEAAIKACFSNNTQSIPDVIAKLGLL